MHPTLRALLEAAKAYGGNNMFRRELHDAADAWHEAGCPGLDDEPTADALADAWEAGAEHALDSLPSDVDRAEMLEAANRAQKKVDAWPRWKREFDLDAALGTKRPTLTDPPEIKIHLAPGARMPTRATDGSAGWDLYAARDELLHNCEHAIDGPQVVDTGVALGLPFGWEAQIRPRSGLSKLGVVGVFGTVDSDYRGRIGVILTGTKEIRTIRKGERIAQLVFKEVPRVRLVQVEDASELGETERGTGGFGSSGR